MYKQNYLTKKMFVLLTLIALVALLGKLYASKFDVVKNITVYASGRPQHAVEGNIASDEGSIQAPNQASQPQFDAADYPDKAKGYKDVVDYINEVWGKDSYLGLRLAHCESRFTKDALNVNRNGSVDYGPFQINGFWKKVYGKDFMTDWQENVRVAYKLFKEHGARQWVCYQKWGGEW